MNQAETNSYWESNGKNIEYLSKLFDRKIRQLPNANFSQLPYEKSLQNGKNQSCSGSLKENQLMTFLL